MKKVTNSFVTGAVALVFAVLGYQTALLVHYAAVAKVTADRDRPDTVYVYCENGHEAGRAETKSHTPAMQQHIEHRTMEKRSPVAAKIRETVPPRKIESFRFDPNTAPVEDLLRLGFTPKQAEMIGKYRNKGGRFRKKEDFARNYAVTDSLFRRLEPFIDIPLIDLNQADSAAFDSLPGIGGYFARKMVEYRERLHGYSHPGQLMEIRNFDKDRFEALKDLITVSPPEPYKIWELPEDSLRRHPHIGASAHGIVVFRKNNPETGWTVGNLEAAGVLSEGQARKLEKCLIADHP